MRKENGSTPKDFTVLPCPKVLRGGPQETTAIQDHETTEAVTSSLDSAFSAFYYPSLETPEPLISQIGEIPLHVVRIDLLKDCEILGSNNVGPVTETKFKRGAVVGGKNKKMSRGRALEGHD